MQFDPFAYADRKASRDPRQLLAQSLLAGSQGPARNAWEGLSQAGKMILGAYLQGEANDRYDANVDERRNSTDAFVSASGIDMPQGSENWSPEMRGNYALALMQKEPKETFTTMSPEEIKQAGLPDGTAAQKSSTTSGITVLNKPEIGQQWKPPAGYFANEPGNPAAGVSTVPGYWEQQLKIRNASRPTTTVNMPPNEEEEKKAWGKSLVTRYDQAAERATAAGDLLGHINIARDINRNRPELASTSQMQSFLGNLGSKLGFDAEQMGAMGLGDVTGAQQFVGIMQNMVLSKMQAQKGPQTENDAKRIEETVASLGQTPESRDFLLQAASSIYERDIAKEQFLSDWRAEKGTLDGAFREWNKTFGSAPLIKYDKKHGTVTVTRWLKAAKERNPGWSTEELLTRWRSYVDG